ncbi:MAG: winged-helix domain-containing protein, partial [Oscillospiraceae bacterium]
MTNQNRVSLPVIKRLPKYFRYVSEMKQSGITKISSSELAKTMGTTASQVRQDFNCFGGFV